ncbi:hypothetical protein L1987_06611 [Smallanthus sonchifolius]|uniref:Uncharacterized protein n=1 Tax=Smallanthus sonchifolius TaxID=185202 RepID=A0ACB9JYK1_9ASTR|nr:hypothetical protein L1987_06611 [Smallanthus sonchifolius]
MSCCYIKPKSASYVDTVRKAVGENREGYLVPSVQNDPRADGHVVQSPSQAELDGCLYCHVASVQPERPKELQDGGGRRPVACGWWWSARGYLVALDGGDWRLIDGGGGSRWSLVMMYGGGRRWPGSDGGVREVTVPDGGCRRYFRVLWLKTATL